jgi:hypothetical protein
MISGFEASSGWPAILFSAGHGRAGKFALPGERIWMVTTTAGSRKIIVTLTHVRAAANSWSWSGEAVRI